MAVSIRSKISAELEAKRRRAQMAAADVRDAAYARYPELSDFDRDISNVATEYTKRMIAGEDLKNSLQAEVAAVLRKKNEFLKVRGIDPRDFEPQYECKKCDDTGIINGVLCDCFKNRVIEENFKNSNIGLLLEDQSFESFRLDFYPDREIAGKPITTRTNMEHNLGKCQRFADRFDDIRKSILMTGATGLGKTYLSTCIAKELLKKGKSVIYISAVDFFKRLEKGRFDSENTDIEMFENCDLLIIDDLGAEAPSTYTTAVFSDILDKRMSRGKKMIINTNNALRELDKVYGQRVYSRLVGNFECLIFYGDDIRIKRAFEGD